MEDSVVLKMLVNRSVADELMQKDLAEIVLRRADSKFKAFSKCRILGDGLEDNVKQKISSSAMKVFNTDSVSLSDVRSSMRKYTHSIEKISTVTKNMSVQVDSIYQMSNVIRNLSFINTGIALANLAVDVVGFVMISNKLNSLQADMRTVTNELKKLSDMAKNEKISVFQKLIMTYNLISSKIVHSEPVDNDDIEKLLIELRAFISEMFRNLQENALEKELVLNIIYGLLPAYTQLLGELLKRSYYERACLPANYSNFVSLYEELDNDDFRKSLEDYFFLNKKMRSQDVIDLVNAQSLFVINQGVLIEDQASMLKMFGSGEQYDAFELELDEIIKSMVREKIPAIAKEAGVDEAACKKYFAFEN